MVLKQINNTLLFLTMSTRLSNFEKQFKGNFKKWTNVCFYELLNMDKNKPYLLVQVE